MSRDLKSRWQYLEHRAELVVLARQAGQKLGDTVMGWAVLALGAEEEGSVRRLAVAFGCEAIQRFEIR